MMELTRDNYYSREADLEYMSCSQYQAFLECEARQMAKLKGRWEDSPSEAFLVGNYFHTFFEGEEAHARFCEENFNSIFKAKPDKKTGALNVTGKYAPYEMADRMIRTACDDSLIMNFIEMSGENEAIMTGELFGAPWRIRVDKYVSGDGGRMIIDWKTTKNIWETSYNPERRERETFIETYGYMMRAAVYSEIEKQHIGKMLGRTVTDDPHFIIVAISKQDPPDKSVLRLNHRQRYDWELEQIKERIYHIFSLKQGRARPKRCGYCEYCRSTKRLEFVGVLPYYKLRPECRDSREEDYAAEMLDDAPEAGGVELLPALRRSAQMDNGVGGGVVAV